MTDSHAKGELDAVSPPAQNPADLEDALHAARASGRYLVAVWHVADGRLHFFRATSGFPLADLDEAERLLHGDFQTIQ